MDQSNMIGAKATSGLRALLAALAIAGPVLAGASAQAEGEINLYSSRHYDTDERLYTEFTEQTGIKVNRLEDRADVLLARLGAEGDNSPADLLITTDAGRLWAATQAELFEPVDSALLKERIPENMRHPEDLWFGFSSRARVIFYAKERVDPAAIKTYADLADPQYKGRVCTRSSDNIYMISLMASIVAHRGADAARDWAKGVWDNRARPPQGGDTDQLRGIVSGQCDLAIGNTYYYSRAFRLSVRGLSHPDQTGLVGVIFPNQDTTGTHINISGGGLLKTAPNRENAIRFLEYLASDGAQRYFSDGNDEYPAVSGLKATSAVLSLGEFKADDLSLAVLGENQAEARRLYDEAGFK